MTKCRPLNFLLPHRVSGRVPVLFLMFVSLLALVFILLPVSANLTLAANQDGAVDPTFKTGSGPNWGVTGIAIQSDGKILISGSFTHYNNTLINGLARLNTDGSLDTTFNVGSGITSTVTNGYISVASIALQADGKVLIGGNFTHYNGTASKGVARLNSDGSLDTTFNPGTGIGAGVNDGVLSLALQADGKVLVGGGFSSYNGTPRNRIARLNSDGSLDTTFNPGTGADNVVFNLALQANGKVLIGGTFTHYNGIPRNRIARLNADGSLDTTFDVGTGVNDTIASIAIQADGKVLIGGYFATYNGTASKALARLNADGSLDSSFNMGTGIGAGFSYITTMAIQNDNKILIGGYFTSYNGTPTRHIARLNSDGSLHTSFSLDVITDSTLYSMAIQSDNKILIGGDFTSYNSMPANHIARLNADSSLDTSFTASAGGTGANGYVASIALQADSKVLIGGGFTHYNGTPGAGIARLNSDGTLDATFNVGSGITVTNGYGSVKTIALQADSKVLIGGSFTHYNGTPASGIVRLNSDGTLDATFNPGIGANNNIANIALQPDGKVLIGGSFTHYNGTPRNRIARLNSDGSLDTTFNPGTGVTDINDSIVTMAIQADGKVLIGGYFAIYNGTASKGIARLNADGSLDTTFNVGTGADGGVLSLAIQADGKVLIGGSFSTYNGTASKGLARLNADGSLDTTFNIGAGPNSSVASIAIQSDKKILIGGYFAAYNGTASKGIARLNADGSLDTTFNIGAGPNDSVASIAIQADSKVLIGGYFTVVANYTRNHLARLENTIKLASSVVLTADPQSANIGQSVIFTATTTPLAATGTVRFTFGTGASSSTVTSTLIDGVATYMTNTLPLGSTPVYVVYGGDNIYAGSTSQVYTQLIIAACNPQIVTSISDDGQASICGTLSYALNTTSSGTISFALTGGDTITFTSSLTATLKPGVVLAGGVNGIVLNGNGVAGDGLRLGGANTLTNLTIRRFSGRELIAVPGATSTQFYRVNVES